MKTTTFAQKTGRIVIPAAEPFTPTRSPILNDDVPSELLSNGWPDQSKDFVRSRFCRTNLKEGCYSVNVTFPGRRAIYVRWRGTIRVDKAEGGVCISGDLYKSRRWDRISAYRRRQAEFSRELAISDYALLSPFIKKKIPVYPRRSYYAYLLGTSAQFFAIRRATQPCTFNLNFDLYEFEHSETGFEGAFPLAPTTAVRLAMVHTDTADRFTGSIYEGDVEVGTVTMEWISEYFRKAYVDVHTLQGAVAPQDVPDPDGTGTETFRTIFATAGWDLSVAYKSPDISIPDSLAGTQSSSDCWSRENAHELLESVPEYEASELDKQWKVHLLAIEGHLGCYLGRMFDNEIDPSDVGDANNVAREGAVTYSHAGYDDPNFGDNENDLQKDTPRAFLRSAAHEVGHAFNMIHVGDEGANDNSIMTTTGYMVVELNNAGLEFPEDIALSFNALTRHHLVHRPDPWVRPGALEFTGSLAASPEADDVFFYDDSRLKLELSLSKDAIKLGELVTLSWEVTNTSNSPIAVPAVITDSSFIARVSITYPEESIRYVRPVDVNADIEVPLRFLPPGKSMSAQTTLFWNKKGFVFTRPGRHTIEVHILWADSGLHACVHAARPLWVDYPVTSAENDVAALMLHDDVGRYVAFNGRRPIKEAIRRIEKVMTDHKSHPVCKLLKDIPGHRFSSAKLRSTRKRIEAKPDKGGGKSPKSE